MKPTNNEISRWTIDLSLEVKSRKGFSNAPEIETVLDTLVQIIRRNVQKVIERDEYNLYASFNDTLNSFDFCIWTRKLTSEEVELLNNALCIKYLFLKDFGTLIRSKLEWSGEFDD